uniref:Cytochrome b6/f complex subunit VI n=1 Tax=Cyanidiaceae sp. MX-AZ01 TaxID=1503164 RepID=A0A060A9A9_9RHOD|nr:cytochrome b6/f complex subunit VI [Cyanidiaceae sp. MX-AZ01]
MLISYIAFLLFYFILALTSYKLLRKIQWI